MYVCVWIYVRSLNFYHNLNFLYLQFNNFAFIFHFSDILNETKLIKPNLGDLPQVLAQRLVDSNAKIAQTTIEICQQIATVSLKHKNFLYRI